MNDYRAESRWFSEFLMDIIDDEGSLNSMRDYIPDNDEPDTTPEYYDYIVLVDDEDWGWGFIDATDDSAAYAEALDMLDYHGWPTSDAVVTVKRAA